MTALLTKQSEWRESVSTRVVHRIVTLHTLSVGIVSLERSEAALTPQARQCVPSNRNMFSVRLATPMMWEHMRNVSGETPRHCIATEVSKMQCALTNCHSVFCPTSSEPHTVLYDLRQYFFTDTLEAYNTTYSVPPFGVHHEYFSIHTTSQWPTSTHKLRHKPLTLTPQGITHAAACTQTGSRGSHRSRHSTSRTPPRTTLAPPALNPSAGSQGKHRHLPPSQARAV